MKQFTISKNDSGQRLNKFLEKAVPLLPGGMMHKYIRIKRIKVNGKRTDFAYRLQQGDVLQLYINDEFFGKPKKHSEEESYLHAKPNIDVIYEDQHILLVNKPAGLVVHADDSGTSDTLIAAFRRIYISTAAGTQTKRHRLRRLCATALTAAPPAL